MYCTRTPGHECTVQYPYSGTLDVSVRARVRLVLPYSGTWDVLYSTRTPGHWMYPYVRSTVAPPYSGTWDVLYPSPSCTHTPGHECTVQYPYSGTWDVLYSTRTPGHWMYIRTCVVVRYSRTPGHAMYCTRTPGHECTVYSTGYLYSGMTLDVSVRARVRLVLPYSGTWDVLYSTRTPGHWMYPYVRSSTPVLREMGCTVLVPILRDMNVPYYTRTPGHWMYPYERVRQILPYSGTWDVLSYLGSYQVVQYPYSGTSYYIKPRLTDCIYLSVCPSANSVRCVRTILQGPGGPPEAASWMYPYVRSSTPVLRDDMGCTVPVLRDMNVPYYT